MSPQRIVHCRVNKHAKTLHCECGRSYTRADHFEHHKQVCRHNSEFLAASEPLHDMGLDACSFYCSCGAGYIAAHAFTRHCRRTGHDGDWLRSTYQPKGYQAILVAAEPQTATENMMSQQQGWISVPNDVTHQCPETDLVASIPSPVEPFKSDDSSLGFYIKGDELSELYQEIEQADPVILHHQHSNENFLGSFTPDFSDIRMDSDHHALSFDQSSSKCDVVPLEAESKDESSPIQEVPSVPSQGHDNINLTEELSTSNIDDTTHLTTADESESMSKKSDSTIQADNHTENLLASLSLPKVENNSALNDENSQIETMSNSTGFTQLTDHESVDTMSQVSESSIQAGSNAPSPPTSPPFEKFKIRSDVEDDYPPVKIIDLTYDAPKSSASRARATKGLRSSTLHHKTADHSGVSNT